VLTFDNKAFRRVASFAPYDCVVILTNGNTYGGGGIYHLYTTTAAGSVWAPYIFVHEFGHHFAGLADEYYTSPVAYNPPAVRAEPWEPNVTAVADRAKLKWKDLAGAGVPVPTPWRKAEYHAVSCDFQKRRIQIRKDRRPEAEMDALFLEEKKTLEPKLAAEAFAGKVGAFEGAGYADAGLYRPAVNCIMFTRTEAFCPVCRRAIEQSIDRLTAKP
jgi:IgA Peptidase M64